MAMRANYEELLFQILQATSESLMNLSMSLHKERWRKAFLMRFRDNKTFREIGEELNITRSTAQRLVIKTVYRLYRPYRLELFNYYNVRGGCNAQGI